MHANGAGKFVCRVRKNETERARYRRDMATAEGRRKRNRKALAQYHRRKADPIYQLERQLRDMTRFRVRY